MSWFDKLFGEENDSQDDYLAKRNQRRHKAKQNQNDKDSLLPQNNDVYERPRGKFRFPMSGIEDTDANHSTSNEHKSSSNEQQFNEVTNDGRQRSRRRRNSAYEQNIDRQPESTSTTHSYKQAERPDNTLTSVIPSLRRNAGPVIESKIATGDKIINKIFITPSLLDFMIDTK